MLPRLERPASLYMENWSEMGGDRFRYGCVLEFQIAEGKGSICYDQSGYGNDGTIYGARWQKGPMVYALSFDGVDDYVEAPNIGIFDEGTVEFLFEILSLPTEYTPITTQGRHASDGWISILDPYGGRFYFDIYDPDAAARRLVEFKPTSEVGVWYHCAATWKVGEELRTYLDGTFTGYGLPLTSVQPTTRKVEIGGGPTYNKYNNIVFALFRVYERALSADEVFALYSYLISPAIKVPIRGEG